MKNRLWAFCISLLLVGCASFQNPIPEGYDGGTATISDTYSNHAGSTAHFFVLTNVNGALVEDSGYRTRVDNSGRGFAMTPRMVSRQVTTQKQTFTISGFVQFATDAQGMFGDHMLVSGDVGFAPASGESYSITGQLSKNGSSVWIIDSAGEIVGTKVSKTVEAL